MLKIQILGHGLIPRGLGIAPRTELTPADPSYIQVLLGTPGLELKYLNPDTNKLMPLTRENYQSIYKSYGGRAEITPVKPVTSPATAPHVPAAAAAAKIETPKVDEIKVATDAPTNVTSNKPAESEQKPAVNSGTLKTVTNPNEDAKINQNKGNGGNNNNGKK